MHASRDAAAAGATRIAAGAACATAAIGRSAIYDGLAVQCGARSRARVARSPLLLLDLDRPQGAATALFSINRPNLFVFREADHGNGNARGLRGWVASMLTASGMAEPAARVTVLASLCAPDPSQPTLYLCTRADGSLLAIVCEIANALDDRHACVLAVGPGLRAGSVVHGQFRSFTASPFLSPPLEISLRVRLPSDGVEMELVATEDGEIVLQASFSGRRRELSDRTLALLLLRARGDALGRGARRLLDALRDRRRDLPRPGAPRAAALQAR